MAAVLGGLLWLLYYGTSVVSGARHSGPLPPEFPHDSAINLLGFILFCSALLHLAASLVGLQARFQGRAGWRGRVARVLACLAFTSVALHLVLTLGVLGHPVRFQAFGAAGVVSTCASAVLLGLAGLRERVLPRWGNAVLLTTGSLTMLLVYLGTLRYGSIPSYLVDELPFAIAGCAWCAIGVSMRQRLSTTRPPGTVSK